MGITVTPVPAGNPPRFDLSIAPSNNGTVTAITVTRTVAGATVPTRVQPTTGPSPRVMSDYEADWAIDVVYTATVTTNSGTETFTSSATQIVPGIAWMIHPTTPALSCVFDSRTNSSAGVVSLSAAGNPATTIQHDIIGAKYRLVTKSGPRNGTRLTATWATVTLLERDRFKAMVDDQTPILIRVPTSFGWGWEDGYYDIGDISEDRFNPGYGSETRRNWTIPLERVLTPAGTQQATRTYADVTAGFASYNAVRAAYSSYTNLLTDTRS